jgi:hypothetical protein
MTTAIIIIAIIIIVPFILALFVKKEYNVQRHITLNRSVGTVFNYIKFIKNQDYYSKWNMLDPNSKRTYTGEDGTVGFIYTWDSQNKNAGAGSQEIVRVHENDRVGTEVRFERPFKNVAHGYMITEPVSENVTKLTWGISGKNTYPMNLMNLMIDGMLGKDIDESLGNLKKIMEK